MSSDAGKDRHGATAVRRRPGERQERVSPPELRAAMGCFTTGVTVVTTELDEEFHGMTVNSLTSVSLDPPLLLVCFTRDSRTARSVQERGAFIVNILSHRQEALANRFAQPGEEHFHGLPIARDVLGLPMLPGCMAHLTCEVEAEYPGGDHVIVVGHVVRCAGHDSAPLVFFQGRYHDLSGRGRHAEYWYW